NSVLFSDIGVHLHGYVDTYPYELSGEKLDGLGMTLTIGKYRRNSIRQLERHHTLIVITPQDSETSREIAAVRLRLAVVVAHELQTAERTACIVSLGLVLVTYPSVNGI